MHGYVYKVSCSPSTPLLTLTLTLKTWRVHARRYAVAKVLTAGDGAWGAPTRGNESIKRLKWGGVYFGVKYTNVQRVQMGTKPAKVGRLASTLLKYVGSAQRRPPPPRQAFRSVGGPKLLKWGLSERGSNLLKSDRPFTSTTPGWFKKNRRAPSASACHVPSITSTIVY